MAVRTCVLCWWAGAGSDVEDAAASASNALRPLSALEERVRLVAVGRVPREVPPLLLLLRTVRAAGAEEVEEEDMAKARERERRETKQARGKEREGEGEERDFLKGRLLRHWA